MRKSRIEAVETRKRIVEAASVEFRANGIGNTGISGLMAAVGLTNGGFYKHFESKDQAVAEACAYSIEALVEDLAQPMAGRKGHAAVNAAVNSYLTEGHRAHAGDGCPFAALGSELARGSDQVRDAATAGVRRLVELLASPQHEGTTAAANKEAMVKLSAMVGAMTLARIVNDERMSQDILKHMRQHLTA